MKSKWGDYFFNALFSTGSVSKGVQRVDAQDLPTRDEMKIFATFAVEVYFDQRERRIQTIRNRLRALPKREATASSSEQNSMKMFLASGKSDCLEGDEVAFLRAESTDTEASISVLRHKGNNRAYGFFRPKTTTVVCDFRGTEMTSWSDIKTNLLVRHSRMFSDEQDCLHVTKKQKQTFLVHSGFQKGWLSIKDQLVEKLLAILESLHREASLNENGERVQLAFTGHSLGGALAIVSAVDLFHEKRFSSYFSNSNWRIFTFGAPQTFAHSFAEYVNAQMSKNMFRVNTRHDIFPRSNLFFFHSGQNIVLAPRSIVERSVPYIGLCLKSCGGRPVGAVQLLNPARIATTLGWLRYAIALIFCDLLIIGFTSESRKRTAQGLVALLTILYVVIELYLPLRSLRDHRMRVYWDKVENIPNNNPFIWTDSFWCSIGLGLFSCKCKTRSISSYQVSPLVS